MRQFEKRVPSLSDREGSTERMFTSASAMSEAREHLTRTRTTTEKRDCNFCHSSPFFLATIALLYSMIWGK